jgi:outer membrane protein assembly factor BamA
VGVTSGGDFFGGTQVALTDVLGDQNFLFTAVSVRELRSYDGTYINLAKRFHYGLSVFDTTRFFFVSPLALQQSFFREGAFATQRYTGASLIGQYPLDKFRRLELNAGVIRVDEQFENPEVELLVRQRAEQLGVPYFLHKGTVVPLGLALVSETTRFREFGPLSGHTYNLGVQYSPSFGGTLSRTTLEGDVRKYFRIGGSAVFATRVHGFHSTGDQPDVFYFGGNMELRGYPYLSFAGNKGFYANAEFRFSLIDLMKTPLGILGPVRGTLFGGIGGAHFKGEPWDFATSDSGRSYVNDPVFGEPVSGFHLVDGRASFGIGLQFFFLGYPLHFDWSKLTDLKVTSNNTRFDFWVGFDF